MIELQAKDAIAFRKEKPDRYRYPRFPHDENCWEIMERCWHYEPSQRQEMHCLLQSLDAVLWRSLRTIPFPWCSVLLKTAYSVLPKKLEIKVAPQYPSCSWTGTNNDIWRVSQSLVCFIYLTNLMRTSGHRFERKHRGMTSLQLLCATFPECSHRAQ